MTPFRTNGVRRTTNKKLSPEVTPRISRSYGKRIVVATDACDPTDVLRSVFTAEIVASDSDVMDLMSCPLLYSNTT